VINNELQIITSVNLGDSIAVTTWNDTAQQAPLTLVFLGPIVTGLTVAEGYDSTVFDAAAISGTPGSYDYSTGTAVANNDFWLERAGVEASRLWVTLDGQRLFEGQDFVVDGEYLVLSSGAIGASQILAVTEFTSSLVPEAMAFRIFQDMRGVQATYRITAATSTTVTQPVGQTDSVIYVDDVRKLSEPDLEVGIFGVITINGERIMYRTINYDNNSISSLLRGTAGTAAAEHAVGADVYDTGRGNLLPEQYQDYVVKDSSMGDGTTSVFYAPSIVFEDFLDSSSERPAIEVYVGGTRQYAYSDTSATSQYRCFVSQFNPVAIEFVVDNVQRVNAGSFVIGTQYRISYVGTTDFVAIGASSNTLGATFTATGVGSGTGKATIGYPELTAPPPGVEVTILVRECSTTWYQLGDGTASDGVALQDTDTQAARFLRGL
jgi:hypothetical protein